MKQAIASVSNRGGRIHLLMGSEDASQDEIEGLFGRGGRGFVALAGMTLVVEERLDHGLVYQSSRALALAALERWLLGSFTDQERPQGASRAGRRRRRA